jgi:hypothetical protein
MNVENMQQYFPDEIGELVKKKVEVEEEGKATFIATIACGPHCYVAKSETGSTKTYLEPGSPIVLSSGDTVIDLRKIQR